MQALATHGANQSHLEIPLEGALVQLHEPLVFRRLVRCVPVEELAAQPFQRRFQRHWDDVVHRKGHQLETVTRGRAHPTRGFLLY